MPKSISAILQETVSLKSKEDKIMHLRQNDNGAIRTVLRYALDPNIKWLLPTGDAPYTPSEYKHQEGVLYMEARRLYLFVEGDTRSNPNVKPFKREMMYLELLQMVDPEDAKLLVAIKDKKLPYKGITKEIVQQAYPGIF